MFSDFFLHLPLKVKISKDYFSSLNLPSSQRIVLSTALMYASIFGNLTAIIQRLYSRTSRFHRDLRVIEDFVRFYKIPKATKEELDEYFRHEWAYTKGVDMETVS